MYQLPFLRNFLLYNLPLAIKPGTKLGPYEIVTSIGAGGMGEVYRAKDTRLNRTVAIKVLPSHLSQNSQLKQRFEREARAVSSLSHPNICALFDIGHENGTEYLVMEYLEGETLAQRLDKGSMPTEQTLRYGIQIAEALDKAHRQGIVHRDLKPGNVMITKSGAKLLDFGLAKYDEQAGLNDGSVLETRDRPLTEDGIVLGTVQYMAPEQLEGKQVDARTDIFALGEIIYEMATGNRAFSGTSRTSLISAILTSQPVPLSQIQPLSPPALEHVVSKCLNKDAEDRWQSAHDVASELKWISEQTSQTRMTAAVGVKRHLPERALWIPLLLLAMAAAGYFYHRSTIIPQGELLRVAILPLNKTQSASMTVSPNGKVIIFSAQGKDGSSALYLRKLDSGSVKRLTGTEGAGPWGLAWSPDGRYISFGANGKFKKLDVNEGPPQTLADASSLRGASWNSEGTILFSPTFSATPIYRISTDGGQPVAVTKLDTSHQETSHRWPFFLPDGKHFLYSVVGNDPAYSGLYVGSIDSKETKRISDYVFNAEYTAPGYLLYVRENNLIAQRFDAASLKFSGEPITVSDKVTFDGASYYYSTSNSGVIAYSDLDLLNVNLDWIGRNGNLLTHAAEEKGYIEPYLSPDEKKVVLGITNALEGKTDLWIYEFARKSLTRFTFGGGSKYGAVWSPDGSTIVYAARKKGNYDLYQRPSTGGTDDQELLSTPEGKFPDDWSKDGKYLIYESEDPKTNYDLWTLPMSGDRKPMPYLQSPFNEAHARFSPDGKWVSYGSDEIGRTEIYIRPFPNASAAKYQISTGGGDQPMWRGDGKELYFLSADAVLMAVDINASGSTLDVGVPKILFKTDLPIGPLVGAERNYSAVSADGQKFLIKVPPADLSVTPISVILNWMRLLQK